VFVPVFVEIISNRNRPSDRQPFLHLFAGHRETVSALLTILSNPLQKAPRFGDHIELELLRRPDKSVVVRGSCCLVQFHV
jgi:hypothetical protein